MSFLETDGCLVCDSKHEKRYKSMITLIGKEGEVCEFISNMIDNVLDNASAGLSEEAREKFYQSLILQENPLFMRKKH